VLLGQRSLLGGGAPTIGSLAPLVRRELAAGAWVDYMPGWVTGQEALLESLLASTRWQQPRREMYDRMVDVPRLLAGLPADGPGHPLLIEMQRALAQRYGLEFSRVSCAFYRDGNDSVAWHGDTTAREMDQAIVATVSLGQPRKFLLRPKAGGTSIAYQLGWGDLIVMGGTCQRTWQHAIPKVAHAHPRMVVMFRPIWPELPRRRAHDGY
jgi:alkylated DNA repair dioxygenase AlkB